MNLLFILLVTTGSFILQLVVPAFVAAICFVTINSVWADKKKANTALLIVGIVLGVVVIWRAFAFAHGG